MVQNKTKQNKLSLILGLSIIVVVLIFLFCSVSYAHNGVYYGPIRGFNSVFGIQTSIHGSLNDFTLKFHTFNGVGMSLLILFLLSGISCGYLSKYERGFHIFATVLDVIIIVLLFTYHSSWVKLNITQNIKVLGQLQVGVGQIIAACLMIVHAIATIVAFNLANTKIKR